MTDERRRWVDDLDVPVEVTKDGDPESDDVEDSVDPEEDD
jgi:hypothetical protein